MSPKTGAQFIVPMSFPAAPKLPTESDWEQVTLDQLRAWDWAPENAALLRQQGFFSIGTRLAIRRKYRC